MQKHDMLLFPSDIDITPLESSSGNRMELNYCKPSALYMYPRQNTIWQRTRLSSVLEVGYTMSKGNTMSSAKREPQPTVLVFVDWPNVTIGYQLSDRLSSLRLSSTKFKRQKKPVI